MSESILSRPQAELLLGTTECCLLALDKAIREGTSETLADLYRWTNKLRPVASRSLGSIYSREPIRVCGISAMNIPTLICRLGQRTLCLAYIVVQTDPSAKTLDPKLFDEHAELIGRYLRHFFGEDIKVDWLRDKMLVEANAPKVVEPVAGRALFGMSFPIVEVEWLEVCEMMPEGWVEMDAEARLAWIEKTERSRERDGVEYSDPIGFGDLKKAYKVSLNTLKKWINLGQIRTIQCGDRFVRIAIPDLPHKIRQEYKHKSI